MSADAARPAVQFTRDEFFLLCTTMTDRQNAAEKEGIPIDDPSSVFRMELIQKLINVYYGSRIEPELVT